MRGSPVYVQHGFLPIKATFLIPEEGTSLPRYIKAVSEGQPGSCAPLFCLYRFAQFHIITSSSEIAVAQGNCIC